MTAQPMRCLGPIRLLPAVPSEPPCDDELANRPPWHAEAGDVDGDRRDPDQWTDGSLALSAPPRWRQLPLHVVLPPNCAELDDDEFDPEADGDAEPGGIPTPRSELPPLRPAAHNYVRAVLEVLTGDRSLAQLARGATPQVYAQLEATGRLAGPRSWAGTVRSVHVSEPADGIAEVAAVVERQQRCHALALRLEGLDGRWVMTRVRLGW